MNNLINYKVANDDLEVEYEVISIKQTDQSMSSKIEQINLELQSLIDVRISRQSRLVKILRYSNQLSSLGQVSAEWIESIIDLWYYYEKFLFEGLKKYI